MKFVIENDLFKAMHKYIKRTGTQGNYKYWYEMPNGDVVAQDDQQANGKVEHIKRLIAGRMRGIHNKTNEEIAREVGVDKEKVRQHTVNMGRSAAQPHLSYHESHLHEANTDVNHESYQRHVGASSSQSNTESTSTRSRGNRTSESRPSSTATAESARETSSTTSATPRRPRQSRTRQQPSEASASNRSSSQESHQEQQAGQNQSQPQAESGAASSKTKREKELIDQLKNIYGIDLGASSSRTQTDSEQSSSTSRQETQPQEDSAEEAQIRENVARANEQLAQARESERRAREATARAESSPEQPQAREMAASDPTFARDEAIISDMIREQRDGGNPYLRQASQIFERISANVKPERRQVVGHVLAALNYLKDEDRPFNKENLVEEYKRISGKNIRGISGIADEFEKATFFTLDEVMGNEPINAEVERMKRGYAAKQFARSKPFLKPEWLQANAGAPPPFPTFGDFKSWTQHGGKPEWAGTTRLAVPREIFDAAPKGADGKPKYPPAWIPLHLMPVWNYAYKRMGGDEAYQAGPTGVTPNSNTPTGFNIDMGAQAQYQEGMIKAAIRKYVQMRGGADQLTDIPKSKLAEAGLTHADIYKSEDIESILKTKIIDPVALAPYVDAELAKGRVKKSFMLVIPKNIDFDIKKSFLTFDEIENLRKAELINKIKTLKSTRQFVIGKQK